MAILSNNAAHHPVVYITHADITDPGVFKWFLYYLISIKSRTTEVDPNQETKQNKLE
jgi:hypothetical protein